jgi:multidrug efflux system outer membrane protein
MSKPSIIQKSTRSIFILCATLLTACIRPVGPDYHKPDVGDLVPAQWSWQEAKPSDHLPKGDWWQCFNDPNLNELEERALMANPTLQAAVARVDQARAMTQLTWASLFPDIRLNPAYDRQRTSGNLPTPVPVDIPSTRIHRFDLGLDMTYEIDVWGRIRRMVESAEAATQASAADYQQVLLTLTADVASQYFLLRALDTQQSNLEQIVADQETAHQLNQQRFEAGTISEAMLSESKINLTTQQAARAEVKRQRAELTHALALLLGEPAGIDSFQFDTPQPTTHPPVIPAGLPADLLERRPDIAAAERLVAARNAELGVVVAAYYPSVTLTGQGGQLSRDMNSLFSSDSSTWSIGPSVSLPLTGIGLISKKARQVRAAREEAVATYRLAVLNGIRDVETSLSNIRFRNEQKRNANEAATAAATAEIKARQLYEAGAINQTQWLQAHKSKLETITQKAQVTAHHHIATIGLIKALGGGWDAETILTKKKP